MSLQSDLDKIEVIKRNIHSSIASKGVVFLMIHLLKNMQKKLPVLRVEQLPVRLSL